MSRVCMSTPLSMSYKLINVYTCILCMDVYKFNMQVDFMKLSAVAIAEVITKHSLVSPNSFPKISWSLGGLEDAIVFSFHSLDSTVCSGRI